MKVQAKMSRIRKYSSLIRLQLIFSYALLYTITSEILAKVAEPTQVLVATVRKKYMRGKNMQFMQRRQRDGDQAVSQTNLSATPDVFNAEQDRSVRYFASQAIEDIGTVKLPSTQNAKTNGDHLYSIEDIGTVKLPSTQNAKTNGDHLQTIEDIGTVKLPSRRLKFLWTEVEGVEPLARAPAVHDGQSEEQTLSTLALEKLAAQRASPSRLPRPRVKRRRLLLVMNIILLMTLIFALVRLTSILSATDDQLRFSLGSQGTALVDLRQSSTISPYLFGANVFPKMSSDSVDQRYSGFMNYSPPITSGLRNAHINLLRFPGGSWGEEHLLSYGQLNDFSVLLSEVGADGMIQVPLTGPTGKSSHVLASLVDRANLSGRWVDYMNNPHSSLRTGKYANAPFHPIKFWTVGNEPDLLLNPDTGKRFTVAEYVNEFIQFSLMMHQHDPTIQVFGPEISQFYGVGVGPTDPNGLLWME